MMFAAWCACQELDIRAKLGRLDGIIQRLRIVKGRKAARDRAYDEGAAILSPSFRIVHTYTCNGVNNDDWR